MITKQFTNKGTYNQTYAYMYTYTGIYTYFACIYYKGSPLIKENSSLNIFRTSFGRNDITQAHFKDDTEGR